MTYWYAHELAKICHVSVRTLHHYDRIGLLEPSLREPNGYRLYTEDDLSKLQQIIALKFFGFSLQHIQKLLKQPMNIAEQLSLQAKLLRQKAESLAEASTNLNKIIASCEGGKSVPWETIIQTIEGLS